MAYDEDEARSAARARLNARMQRRETAPVQAGSGVSAVCLESMNVPKKARVQPPKAIPAKPIAAVVGGVTLVIVLAVALSQCVSAGFPTAFGDDDTPPNAPAVIIDPANSAQAKLVELIGEDETVKLLSRALTDKSALWIASHPDAFGSDGLEVEQKILKLAADEPAALEYVRSYPELYPMRKPSSDKANKSSEQALTGTASNSNVPRLYQWDMRWGYTTYSSAAFGLTGCGPTALAMVSQALIESDDTTPYEMGKIADEHGYMTQFNGTGREFFTEMAGALDLYCEQLYPTGESILEALGNGAVIVANAGPGQFTDEGHYLVIAGCTDDGRVVINDPYSAERSSQTWDAETIADESIALFAYTALE